MSIKEKIQKLVEQSETVKLSLEALGTKDIGDYTIDELKEFTQSEDFSVLSEEDQKALLDYISEADNSDEDADKDDSEEDDEDSESEEDDDSDDDKDAKSDVVIMASDKNKANKEMDMSEDMEALFNGETLDEEFKVKAATIFEAAVLSRVKAETEELDEIYATQLAEAKDSFEAKVKFLEEEFAQKLEEQVEEVKDGLVEHVDEFLNFMVEQWINDNDVALENGIKTEIAENVISGLHSLFTENYVTVPEEKLDLVSEMESKLEEVLEKLDEQVKVNIDLTKTINESKREGLIEKAAHGLTDIDAEKFRGLAEEITFENPESFESKLVTIKENYFTKKQSSAKKVITEVAITDEPIKELNEDKKQVQTPLMDAYLKQLSRK